MKRIILSLNFLSIVFFVSAQTMNRQYDSIIQRTIERNVAIPDCVDCTGVCLLQVTRKDSIEIKTLYSSDSRYDLGNNKNLLRRLNERCNTYIKEQYKVVVPILFYYEGQPPPQTLLEGVENRIKNLKRNNHVMNRVIMVSYGVQR